MGSKGKQPGEAAGREPASNDPPQFRVEWRRNLEARTNQNFIQRNRAKYKPSWDHIWLKPSNMDPTPARIRGDFDRSWPEVREVGLGETNPRRGRPNVARCWTNSGCIPRLCARRILRSNQVIPARPKTRVAETPPLRHGRPAGKRSTSPPLAHAWPRTGLEHAIPQYSAKGTGRGQRPGGQAPGRGMGGGAAKEGNWPRTRQEEGRL